MTSDEETTQQHPPPVDIVINSQNDSKEEDDESTENTAESYHHLTQREKEELALAALPLRGRMSFYTLGKVYHWLSRAKVAVMFRIAFNLQSHSSATSSANQSPVHAESMGSASSLTKRHSPKTFYDLPHRWVAIVIGYGYFPFRIFSHT